MKSTFSLALPLVIALLILPLSTTVMAGDRSHYYSQYGGHYGNYGKHKFYNNHYRGHRYFDHRGRHYGKHYYKHRRHNHDKYLIGGLLLGGLLHHAYHQPRKPRVIYRTVIHHSSNYPSTDSRSQASGPVLSPGEYTRRFIRDDDGRCFELIERHDGSEQLTEKGAEYCEE